ncbi:hypothetical protein KKA15_05900 [Patescibacteria group bacterium]|nr:hypothetical protein [Patescibacteria group bacterium]
MDNIKDILNKKQTIKAPAYPWQDLALRIIDELNIPPQKRNSVFLVCKKNSKNEVEKWLNDTKELCKTGECWKYFFKLVNNKETVN